MPELRHALETIDEWRGRRAAAGHLLVALDFDGTLAPIVPQPDEAYADPAVIDALAALGARADTSVALISGRGLADLRSRVGLPGLYYAGNHGLEIEGPGLRRVQPEAMATREHIQSLADALAPRLHRLRGVHLENKGLTLSVHYRQATDPIATRRAIMELLEQLAEDDPLLRLTGGKRVVEIRPRVDWDKGAATRFLLDWIAKGQRLPAALFIGDDVTDEDAFALVADEGIGEGIIVAERLERPTAARAYLASVAEVRAYLRALG